MNSGRMETVTMTEAGFLGGVVIAQFTVLAGLLLYTAGRIERRIDRWIVRTDARGARDDARFDGHDERLRAVEVDHAVAAANPPPT